MINTFVRVSSRSAPSFGPPTGPPARGRTGVVGAVIGAPNEIGSPNEIGADPVTGSAPSAAPPPKSIVSPPNGSFDRPSPSLAVTPFDSSFFVDSFRIELILAPARYSPGVWRDPGRLPRPQTNVHAQSLCAPS